MRLNPDTYGISKKKALGYIWSNYIHKIGFRIFKEGHTFLHTLRYQKTKYKIFEIYNYIPIARPVLNFFQDLEKQTIFRVLRPVWSEFDILSGVEYGVENLRCQHWDLHY